MLYARCVGLAKDVAYPLKPSSSQATRPHLGKAKSYEPEALNETMLPMRRKKIITITHAQHRTTTKEKELRCKTNTSSKIKRAELIGY